MRAAPIVCPEESPLLAAIGDNFAVSKSPGARGRGLQPYGALRLLRLAIRRGAGGERKAPCLLRRAKTLPRKFP